MRQRKRVEWTKTTRIHKGYLEWLLKNNASLLATVEVQDGIIAGLREQVEKLAGEIVELKEPKPLGWKPDMKKYTIRYSHNNSGGRDWVTKKQWRTFSKWGYTVREPFTAERKIWADCESSARAQLQRDFTEIVGDTGDEHGCSCCGPPHWLYAEEGWDEDQ